MAHITKKLIIAQTKQEAILAARERGLNGNYRYINQESKHQLMGLELSWDDVVIVGDPYMSFSFWELLLTRIRKQSKCTCNSKVGEDMETKLNFEEWCEGVDKAHMYWQKKRHKSDCTLMKALGQPEPKPTPDYSYTSDTGVDCWRNYYDDNYSPDEAYQEDCSNA